MSTRTGKTAHGKFILGYRLDRLFVRSTRRELVRGTATYIGGWMNIPVMKYSGPFKIIKEVSPNMLYESDLCDELEARGVHLIFHSKLLKPHDIWFPGHKSIDSKGGCCGFDPAEPNR